MRTKMEASFSYIHTYIYTPTQLQNKRKQTKNTKNIKSKKTTSVTWKPDALLFYYEMKLVLVVSVCVCVNVLVCVIETGTKIR